MSTNGTVTDVDKIKAGGSFWLGRIVQWHEIGPYQIAEYTPRAIDDGDPTQFVGFIDGRDAARIRPTLERAIVGLIAHRHDGSNTQAGEMFARMVGMTEEEDEKSALLAEVEQLRAILAYIDAHAPLADATCAEPGITLSEAARRALAE